MGSDSTVEDVINRIRFVKTKEDRQDSSERSSDGVLTPPNRSPYSASSVLSSRGNISEPRSDHPSRDHESDFRDAQCKPEGLSRVRSSPAATSKTTGSAPVPVLTYKPLSPADPETIQSAKSGNQRRHTQPTAPHPDQLAHWQQYPPYEVHQVLPPLMYHPGLHSGPETTSHRTILPAFSPPSAHQPTDHYASHYHPYSQTPDGRRDSQSPGSTPPTLHKSTRKRPFEPPPYAQMSTEQLISELEHRSISTQTMQIRKASKEEYVLKLEQADRNGNRGKGGLAGVSLRQRSRARD